MAKRKLSAFEQALTDAALARYQEALAQDTEPVEFSQAHQEAVAALTRKTQRRTWRMVNTTAKRILLAAILAVLLATTVVAAVPALREGLIRFFTHDDGIKYTFEFTPEDVARAPKEIETYYAPGYIPPQFALEGENAIEKSITRWYYNQDGDVLTYDQMVLWEYEGELDETDITVHLGISSDGVPTETRIIDGYEVKVAHLSNPNGVESLVVYWTDHEYFYMIGYPAADIQEIEKMILSMAPVPVN